jgi:hypothetical protein
MINGDARVYEVDGVGCFSTVSAIWSDGDSGEGMGWDGGNLSCDRVIGDCNLI